MKKKQWLAATGVFVCAMFALPFTGCGNKSDGSHKTDDEPQATVRYEDFGAIGNGSKDDFQAIIDTHAHANAYGLKVVATPGKTYYIGAHKATALVKTNTDWTGAKFTIDDSKVSVSDRGWNVFEIAPDVSSQEVEFPSGYSIEAGQENLGLRFENDVMLRLVNDKKKDYIRYGNNQNSGSSRQEVILADKNGKVSEDTPVLWDYDTVTKITAYSVQEKAITVKGGSFTTITNTHPVSTSYYARGIAVKRSNTTLEGVEHYITGEPEEGSGDSCSPYTGFFAVNNANNVTLKNCVMTGHVVYSHMKDTGWVQQGTYDTTASNSNAVSWIDCTQSNSITDVKFWGVMSSNFCKNLLMEGCNLSRFDAHQGVYNATIRDTTLGRNFNIIGAGTLTVENVTRINGDNFLWLRSDYGSTWDGDIIFRDCRVTNPANDYSILGGSLTLGWDFGYRCYLPRNIVVDGFTASGLDTCYVFPDSIANLNANTVANSKYPYSITQTFSVENERQDTRIQLAKNTSALFRNTQIKG